MKFGQSQSLNWEIEDVPGPNVESRETLLTLAKMTNNGMLCVLICVRILFNECQSAYVEPGDPAWYDLGEDWNSVRMFFLTRAVPLLEEAPSFSANPSTRRIRLAGSPTRMDSVGRCLPIKPTLRSSSLSKGLLQGFSEEEGQR